MHLKLLVFSLLQGFASSKDAVENKINQIMELDESKRKAYDQSYKNQEKIKRDFDKSTKPRLFSVGDTVLLWDKRNEKPGKHGKFDNLWKNPFIIKDVVEHNSFHLSHLDGEPMNLPVNGKQLKLFFK